MLKKRLHKMSIRWKIVLITVFVSAVALLVAALLLLGSHLAYHRADSRRQLATLAEITSLNVAAAVLFDDRDAAVETLTSLRAVPEVLSAGILGTDGKRFALYQNNDSTAAYEPPADYPRRDIIASRRAFTVFSPIRQGDDELGTLYIHYDLSRMYAWLRRFIVSTGIVMLAALTLAFLLSRQMQRWVTDSLLTLYRVIRNISASHDFSIRATRSTDDEVGELVDGFNQMLDLIQQRDAALQHHRDNLENEVQARTEELDRKNRDLLVETEERRQTAKALQRRVEVERLVSSISTRFLNLKDSEFDEAVRESLKKMGELTQVDLGYVTVHDETGRQIKNFYKWNSSSANADSTDFTGTRLSSLPWIYTRLQSNEPVQIANLSEELPDDASADREFCESNRIHALLCMPMVYRRRLVGTVALACLDAERAWSREEADLVRLVGEIVLGAFQRQWSEKERERLENNVRQSQKLESLGVLTGGIAHDFNNLLMGIMGNAELLADDVVGTDAIESVRSIKSAARQAADLCRQMLVYAGRGRVNIQTIDLNQVLRELSELLKSSVSKKARFNLVFDDDIRCIRADLPQIRQVAMNLIINAAEAVGNNEGVITVRTNMRRCTADFLRHTYFADSLPAGDYVTLEVADTGCGMDKETVKRIFDPFFSTKFTGRGLGLAAVTGIVRAHKAAMQVKSEPGRGSRFTVYIPAVDDQNDSGKDNRGNVKRTTRRQRWKGSGRVLLADDEKTVRATVASMLKRMGLEVIEVEDGSQAVQALRDNLDNVNLVILDMNMPRMSGAEALREIRRFAPNTPVLLSSGYSEHGTNANVAELHPQGFIEKPYTFDELIKKVRNILE